MIDTSVNNIYRVVDLKVNVPFSHKKILSCKTLKFLADLHLNFDNRRLELLSLRKEKQNGFHPTNDLLNSLEELREFYKNEMEIIIPGKSYLLKHSSISDSDKMFLILFQSSNSTSWSEIIQTHINVKEAIGQTLNSIESETEQATRVAQKQIEIMLFPRDLYCEEENILVDKHPLSCAFFDIGVFLFHNARLIAESSSYPYMFLNNIQNYFEAKYWCEIFSYAEEYLGLPSGTIKAFMSFDNRLSEFEKRHILQELNDFVVAT